MSKFIKQIKNINMKTKLSILVLIFSTAFINAQVDIQPNAIGVNVCNPLSELSINSVGDVLHTVRIIADYDGNGSAGLVSLAKDITIGNNFTSGIIGLASNFGPTSNKAIGLSGIASRDMPYSSGRSYGARLVASNSTPGANYGVLAILEGSNSGGAVVGHDAINYSWGQVMSNTVSYAGYFRGKGYFHDNVGIGEADPQSKLHVRNGDVYVEGPANGVILDSGSGCYRITVDAQGVLSTNPVACP